MSDPDEEKIFRHETGFDERWNNFWSEALIPVLCFTWGVLIAFSLVKFAAPREGRWPWEGLIVLLPAGITLGGMLAFYFRKVFGWGALALIPYWFVGLSTLGMLFYLGIAFVTIGALLWLLLMLGLYLGKWVHFWKW